MRTLLTFVAIAAAVAASSTARTVSSQTTDAKKVEAGEKTYATQKCSTCHTIKGTGGKLAGTLDGVGKKLTEADIKKWLTNPAELEARLPKKPAMPMSGWLKTHKLANGDVDALVAYMLSLK